MSDAMYKAQAKELARKAIGYFQAKAYPNEVFPTEIAIEAVDEIFDGHSSTPND